MRIWRKYITFSGPQGSRMAIQPRTGNTAMLPVKNLRVTFWGVRGSCPIFPAPHEVEEFTRQISVLSVFQTLQDIAKNAESSGGKLDLEKIIGGPLTQSTVEAYQRKLGQPDLPIYGGETTCVEVETAEG